MAMIFRIHSGLALLGLGALLVLATGCDAGHSVSKIEPEASPASRSLEDLKKDLKPPVIVKPSVPATTETVPVAPKREAR